MTTILVVEDDGGILEFLSTLLEDEDYEVITAHNGEEGLTCLATKRPAVVLCDLMTPVLGGREMCQRMQANALYRAIPFVLMSAVSSAVKQADCHYAVVLTKPFDLSDLLKTVARLVTTSSSS